MMERIRRSGKENSECGQATVEFALMGVFLFLLICGMLEMFMLIYTYNVLADSAKEGVRYAIVHGTNSSSPSGPTCPCSAIDGAAGTGVVKSYAQYSFTATTGMTVTVTYPDTSNPPANQAPNRVKVLVQYPYKPFFGLSWPTATLYATAEGRIVF